DALGYGIIDAAKSVTTAANGMTVNVLSPSPSVINLNTETQLSSTVDLDVYGNPGQISIDTTVTSPAWLSVSVDTGTTPATLTAQLNSGSPELEPGVPLSTNLTLNYTDMENSQSRTVTIPVSAQVVTDEQQRNAGVHFVLLVNTTPDAQGFYQAEAQVVARVENGEYQFSFPLENGDGVQTQSEVTPGDYFLVAGTDLDNDGIICQPGEACAEYPVSGLREAIHVDQNTDLTNIRMTTGFSRPTISAATPDVLPRPDFAGYRLIPEDDFIRPLKKLSGE
ncbi:MAG: peptidase S8, partial [Marinobacter sp.]|nr:peptidase S8 [Marinobacter sp.]